MPEHLPNEKLLKHTVLRQDENTHGKKWIDEDVEKNLAKWQHTLWHPY